MATMDLPHHFDFKVRTYEVDCFNNIKISSLQNYMQEAASQSADMLGFGYEQLHPQGKFWVLSRVIIKLNGTAAFGETVTVETWPKSHEKLQAFRDFRFKNAEGHVWGTATTSWLIIDEATLKPVAPGHVIAYTHTSGLGDAITVQPLKISVPEQKIALGKRTIVYSDLDVNHHVNNARYADILSDALPAEFFKKYFLSEIQINYLRELKLGDAITLWGSLPDSFPGSVVLDGVNQHEQKTFQARLMFT